MQTTRRVLIGGLSAAAAGFAGLKLLSASAGQAQAMVEGYGPLVPDPARLLDLPRASPTGSSRAKGEPMSDGLLTPAAFDGMACFPVRGARIGGAGPQPRNVAEPDRRAARSAPITRWRVAIPRGKIFDFAADGAPKLGGTTTLIWDMRQQRVVRSHLSLAGTCGNCAGGPTPWGSWLTLRGDDREGRAAGRPRRTAGCSRCRRRRAGWSIRCRSPRWAASSTRRRSSIRAPASSI